MRKTFIDKDLLYDLYVVQGKSTRQIAQELNCNPERVRVNLHRFDIYVRSQSESISKYSHNSSYFSVLNSENCYWAGFIAADGCVCHRNSSILSLRLHLKNTDLIQLENFKKQINFTGVILNDKNSCVLDINSAEQVTFDLKKHFNITERKSLTLEAPNIADLNWGLSYIIGYIDGDGCIMYGNYKSNKDIRLSICGTEHVLNWINSYSNFGGNLYKKKNIHVLHLNGKKCYSFLSTLYDYSIVNNLQPLKRKWDKVSEYRKLNKIIPPVRI